MSSYRHKLKTCLQTDFGEHITFLNPKNTTLTEEVTFFEVPKCRDGENSVMILRNNTLKSLICTHQKPGHLMLKIWEMMN